MILKHTLPVIVAISVLACVLVPLVVVAEVSTVDYSLPSVEQEYIEKYGGFEKVVCSLTLGSEVLEYVFYAPKIGTIVNVDNKSYRVDFLGTYSGFGTYLGAFSSQKDTSGKFTLLKDHVSCYTFPDGNEGVPMLVNYDVISSTCDLYNASDLTEKELWYSVPKAPSALNIATSSVNMSVVMSEVLGVLPACLACMVSYVAIRKGIGFVGSIVKTA